MSAHSRITLLTLCAITVPVWHACNGAPDTPSVAPSFDIFVDLSPTPRYRWEQGSASTLRVAPVEAPTALVWGLVDTATGLRAPLDHGVIPPGAVSVVVPPVVLRPNTRYRVTVTLADGRTSHRQFRTGPASGNRALPSRSD